MKHNTVVWFEIYVEDMARAKAFYEAVLDIKMQDMPSPAGLEEVNMCRFPADTDETMNTYGANGALVKMDGFAPSAGGTFVYFACDDCAVETSRVVKNGGSVVREKTSLGDHGYMTLVKDTEGNMVGFHSM